MKMIAKNNQVKKATQDLNYYQKKSIVKKDNQKVMIQGTSFFEDHFN